MGGALALYPLRLLNYSRNRDSPSNRPLRQRIRIPAAFDPAPILYPAILPVLISISLFSSTQKTLLPNVLLGLAALPSQLIPYGGSPWGYSSLHWLVSVLPLIASENTELLSKLSPPTPYKLKLPPPEEGLHPEILVSLFALHQALLPPLHYLTTTSLLPAELHLLSIALINLYLFADSPQADIPKTLLWLGGVGLLVLCGKVLQWGVALARIPRWRFRRAGQIIRNRQSFLQILNESLKPKRSHSPGSRVSDSDADEDNVMIKKPFKGASLKLDVLASLEHNSILGHNNGNGNGNDHSTQSAIEPSAPIAFPKRRNTLPCLPSPTHAARRRSKSVAQSFLSLTPTQAAIRKWIYACYFYLIVVVMILGPIRYSIGKNALHGHEPFGWAIGYLFGNIQRLRFEVQNWDCEYWIPLPPLSDSSILVTTLGIAEHLRTVVLGEANTRLLLCGYCLSIITLGLTTVLSLTIVEVDTRRKVFHGMMVAMLAPTIFIDPCFIALALSLILAIFLLLDLIRASQLPPLSRPLASFLTPYVDGRDLRGPVVVSHIFLLIGCAIPLWLSLAGTERTGQEPWIGWDVATRDVSMISGVVCVGMGDAAASLIGRRYGRRKWPWAGGKSLEGSAAFAIAVTVGLLAGKVWLKLGGWEDSNGESSGGLMHWVSIVARAMVCAMGASLNEAVLTGGNDNVVVPVVLWVLVRGVRL
jgi:dolichol kinase